MKRAALRNRKWKQPPQGIIYKERGPLDDTPVGKQTHSGDNFEMTIEIKRFKSYKTE